MKIEKYSKIGIEKIKSVDILESEDLSTMVTLSRELQRVFEVHQVFRTETEMRYSVLDDVRFPTPASKYWQSIREQNVFFTNLIMLSCDFEEKQGNLELLEIQLGEIEDSTRKPALIKIKKAQVKRAQFEIMSMRIEARDRVREIRIWEQLKEEQRKLSKFDINDVNANQVESLKQRWKAELEISKITGNQALGKNSLTGLKTMGTSAKDVWEE